MSTSIKYALMVFAGGAVYGAMIPLVHYAYQLGFNPANGMVLHNFIGALILLPIVLVIPRLRRSLAGISRRDIAGLAVVCVLAYGMSAGYFNALSHISAAATVTLMFQYVWMGVVLQAIAEHRRPDIWTILAALVVMVGTVLTTGILDEGTGTLNVPGVLFGLLSAVCYAAFLFVGARVAPGLPAFSRTTIITVGRLFIALAFAPTFFTILPPLHLTATVGVLMALTGIILPILCFQVATPHLPSGVTTIMTSSELPASILLASLFIGEQVTPLMWLGVALVLGGIVLSQTGELRRLFKR
ncbi:MAG: DMT family transporter [Coriobacteriales bacterium]|jgi:drug/metabolite transporter (DMT)-like permease|nr:DMT family transporter [Coriobacteriales bacterium]